MATYFEIRIAGGDSAYAGQAAQAAFGAIDRMEGLLSRFLETSEISQINRLQPGEVVRVSPDVFDCLEQALGLQELTRGAFDPALANRPPAPRGQLLMDRESLLIGLEGGGISLDLGAIGKGYALDVAAGELRSWDVEKVLLIGGGSSLLALAAPVSESDRGWEIALGGVSPPQRLFLENSALGSSGTAVKGEHIIDPRTGTPVPAGHRTWAVASSAAAADALFHGVDDFVPNGNSGDLFRPSGHRSYRANRKTRRQTVVHWRRFTPPLTPMKFILPAFIFLTPLAAGIAVAADNEPAAALTEQWTPVPPVISAPAGGVPSDAIVLFDGKNADAWEPVKSGSKGWNVAGGALTIVPNSGYLRTRAAFGDIQLHVEFREPAPARKSGQDRGNSGVFFIGLYDLQVLDSYNNPTYVNGQAASIYKQYAPLVNACRPPGEWQSYDAVFIAPRFASDGSLLNPARATVFHNGVLALYDVILKGPTLWRGYPHYTPHAARLPLQLQDHGDKVAFRNIWVRELPFQPPLSTR